MPHKLQNWCCFALPLVISVFLLDRRVPPSAKEPAKPSPDAKAGTCEREHC